MTFRLLREGTLIPVPPVEKALRFLESRGGVEASGIARDRRGIIGSPEKVRAGLEEVAREYGAEEMMIVTITHDHAARRRSYELIAEAFAEPSIVTDQPASATSS
jgi:alkanesulfonate monooxygenase SsuD/methylene tetrahydromethanopterin reductase-like flavin-dependent oxidoreductase (luciferase family)